MALNYNKYKHSLGTLHKREFWYSEVKVNTSTTGCSDHSSSLKASKKWIAYKHGASSIGLLNIDKPGKLGNPAAAAYAHTGSVLDLDFSGFDDDLLASCGDDGLVKIWRSAQQQAEQQTLSSIHTFSCASSECKNMDLLQFHPNAANVLAASGGRLIKLFDLNSIEERLSFAADIESEVQSMCWNIQGDRIVTTLKNGNVCVWDCRRAVMTGSGKGHEGIKSSRAIWIENDQILTCGFSKMRQREMMVWDNRNFSEPIVKRQFESSSSGFIPLYDSDTNILYYCGKGDNNVKWIIMSDLISQTPVMNAPVNLGNGLCSAMALTPKLNLKVMETEISRLLCVSGDSIVPISFNVPRKSYRDFHADLFPDTRSPLADLTADEWFSGKEAPIQRISLDPRQQSSWKKKNPDLANGDAQDSRPPSIAPNSPPTINKNSSSSSVTNSRPVSTVLTAPSPAMSPKMSHSNSAVLNSLRKSSFKFLTAKPMHQRENFEDIRQLNYALSSESNVLQANRKYLAFPLTGSGGRITVIPTNKPGRFPPVPPSFICGSDLCDFALSKMDPFDMMITGNEDSKLRVWKIPEGGISKDTETPLAVLSGHLNRVNMVKFHPFVEGMILSSSVEQMALGGSMPTVRLWDINKQKEILKLEGYGDLVSDAMFALNGKKTLATTSKDKYLRISDLRTFSHDLKTICHENVRGSRLSWLDDDFHLITVGFGRGSQREMNLFDTRNFEKPIANLQLDVSPSIMVPHYDADLKILFLCSHGGTSIRAVEVDPSNKTEPFFQLPSFTSPSASIQQGCMFVEKQLLDISNLEIARCWRLTQSSIEPITFSIPRNRKEFFQDDVYPPTRDMEHSTMTTDEWMNADTEIVPQRTMDLCPSGMKRLSEAPVEAKPAPKYTLATGERKMTDSERQQQFLSELFQNAKEDAVDGPLQQDLMDGVDSDEWDD